MTDADARFLARFHAEEREEAKLLAEIEAAEAAALAAVGEKAQLSLFDYDTNEDLGLATAEQIEASFAEAAGGVIAIDADGDVVPTGQEAFAPRPLRIVYVEALAENGVTA